MSARRSMASEFVDLLPYGRGFDLIMADPPWRFGLWSKKGDEKSADAQYRTMKLADIKAMPVPMLAADNCLLWLWATHPMVPQALEVMAAWGFEFKTSGVWVKRTRHGKLGFGTGYILRCASEPFLIGTRGRVRTVRNVRTVIEGKIRKHSQKPEEAFREANRILRAEQYPEGGPLRIELFSRTDRPGWKHWGDEAGSIPLEGVA